MRNLLLEFQGMGHKLYLNSSNGKEAIPSSLLSRIGRDLAIPDVDICYTLPRNFKDRFTKKSKLKLAIYNYETSVFPRMWKNDINFVDYALPSSNFSKEVFVNGGWPEDKCIVVPHGIHPISQEDFDKIPVYGLKSTKSFKMLNVSIPHKRKNLDLLIDAYYRTFSGQDDIVLVLKTSLAKPRQSFEVDVSEIIKEAQARHKSRPGGLPHIEIITARIDDMRSLYKACHVLVSTTSSEGFGLPLLEALDAGKLVIAPKCTGQLDFLNIHNSLLVDVKEIPASKGYQYWVDSQGSTTYIPKLDALSHAMLISYQNYAPLLGMFREESRRVCEEFTWKNAAEKILKIS
jgi:glycosyltransferase involved in cell wall biosynthesis